MKLKDKKIDICEYQHVSEAIGNRTKQAVTVATVWAYFRQLSGDEIYRVTTQTEETVTFRINYRPDITTSHVIRYKGSLYRYYPRGCLRGL